MSKTTGHLLRYLAWAVVGACLVVGLVVALSWPWEGWSTGTWSAVPFLALPAGLGFVLLRAWVGAVSRWPASAADRAMSWGVVLGLLGMGLGYALVLGLITVCDRHLALRGPWLVEELPSQLVGAFVTVGAVALVLVGWLVRRRHGWLVAPLAWLGVLAAGVGVWAAVDEMVRDQLSGVVRGQPFRGGRPASWWLEQLGSRKNLVVPDRELYALLKVLETGTPEELRRVAPLLCGALARAEDSSRQFSLQGVLQRCDPALVFPEDAFNLGSPSRRADYEKNARLTAQALRQLAPPAAAAYRAALRALLTSERPSARCFAAYALGGFGSEAQGEVGTLVEVVEDPADPDESDARAAALALARLGEPTLAARAFLQILQRQNFPEQEERHEINAWAELRLLPAEARAAIRGEIPAGKRHLLDRATPEPS